MQMDMLEFCPNEKINIVKDKLTEINVFSPGGMQIAERLYDVHFAREIVYLLERKVEYLHQYRENFNNVEIVMI